MREGFPKIHETLLSHEETLKQNDRQVSGFGIDESELTEEERQEKIHGPHIDIDFEKLYQTKHDLEEELGLIKNKDGKMEMPSERENELVGKLESLSESEIEQLYIQVLSRVQKETNYFHHLEELGILENIINYDLDDEGGNKKIAGVKIKWLEQNKVKSKGVYDPFENRAYVKKDQPTMRQILEKLFSTGRFSSSLETMTHEISHAQNLPKKIIETIRRIYSLSSSPNQGWSEIYAGRTANNRVDIKTKSEAMSGRLKKRDELSMYTSDPRGEFIDNMAEAVYFIDQLYALGFKADEVGEIMRKEFNRFTGKGTAQKIIQEYAKKLGLDEGDLENLVQARRVENEVGRLMVMNIAQEEINNYN